MNTSLRNLSGKDREEYIADIVRSLKGRGYDDEEARSIALRWLKNIEEAETEFSPAPVTAGA